MLEFYKDYTNNMNQPISFGSSKTSHLDSNKN